MSVFTKAYFLLLLITLALYLFKSRKMGTYSRHIIALMLLWLLTTITAIFLSSYAGFKNNLFVFHILTPVEYGILTLLFNHVIMNPFVKKMAKLSILPFFVLCMLSAFFLQPVTENNAYMIITESVIIVFLSLYYLREIMILQHVTELHRFPMFWITVGLLFYFTGNLLIEGMLNYMIKHSMTLALRSYRLGYIFKYLLFILFITGAGFSKRTQLLPETNYY
ncbi:MAG: hypothetical protein JST02_03985 [Bacteroidetes bacterium]|nr:hypothetical protein [Bacteroidota bacterium]